MPPAPGRMANRVSGSATSVEEVKRRREVVRASSSPPPRAREERAERVGMGRVVIWVKVARRVRRKLDVLFQGGRLRRLHFAGLGELVCRVGDLLFLCHF